MNFSSSGSGSILLWASALALGLICGKLVHSSIKGGMDTSADDKAYAEAPSTAHSRQISLMSASNRYLWRETAELRDPDTFESGINRLYRDTRSPLRASSLQSNRIKDSTFEEWEYLVGEGQLKRMEVLKEVGDHLARLDSERALQLILKGAYKFDHLEQFYTFRNSIFDTVTEIAPELLLSKIKEMPRGGAQMDSGRYFTEVWANRDPAAVAARFDELQQLRNMNLEGATARIPLDEFAGIIMKSWTAKDAEAATDFVESLTSGPKRDALQAALDKSNTIRGNAATR